ncbi:hypothetical protein GCM10022243_05270 [Saccharothrix violaceirubra]|uniref:Uncharacterized protein n=1 Tax=Saccharothrix violaceirubra TaxID=413306 RepID=A0A7W7SYY6_9PSEU|nr:hypothetical protein [Saccharothrix violaceirubra]MBB4962937.1 hypothetical protein [Saccharothrix violaceirubra]
MSVIEVDPAVKAAFDERLEAARRANAQVTGALQADRERLAAEAREREARLVADRERLREKAEKVVAEGDKASQRQSQWAPAQQRDGELAFGPEEEDDVPPAPAPAPAPVSAGVPLPPATPRRRSAPVEDDDDLSGQSWLT